MKLPRTPTAKIYVYGFKPGKLVFGDFRSCQRMTYGKALNAVSHLPMRFSREIYELRPIKTFKRGEKVS